jgi:hypothetical protein
VSPRSGWTPGEAPAQERAQLLAEHTEVVAALADRMRALILTAMPDAREVVYRGWHGFGFHHRRAGYVCAVFPQADQVSVAFERGAELPDPHGVLTGAGRTVRWVPVLPGAAPPTEALVELIDAALALPPRSAARRRGR